MKSIRVEGNTRLSRICPLIYKAAVCWLLVLAACSNLTVIANDETAESMSSVSPTMKVSDETTRPNSTVSSTIITTDETASSKSPIDPTAYLTFLHKPGRGVPTRQARGRVQIINNNVVADNGSPLRGEAIYLTDPKGSTTGNFKLSHLYDLSYWQALRDDFHLNAVRLLIMRPPQNWPGGPGANCWPPIYRCYPLDYLLNPPDTALDVIDDVVDIAEQMGMYIIIDYHPVGGHDKNDAVNWWTQIAPRYKDRSHVIYELANEPVAWSPLDYDHDDIKFEEDLFGIIRSLAPDTHIILWSFAQGSGSMVDVVNQGSTIDYANASVGYHPYSYNRTDILTLRSNFPIISTEIGGGTHQAMTQEAEDIGVSWIQLGGARTHNVGDSDGFFPSDIYWPADPGTGS